MTRQHEAGTDQRDGWLSGVERVSIVLISLGRGLLLGGLGGILTGSWVGGIYAIIAAALMPPVSLTAVSSVLGGVLGGLATWSWLRTRDHTRRWELIGLGVAVGAATGLGTDGLGVLYVAVIGAAILVPAGAAIGLIAGCLAGLIQVTCCYPACPVNMAMVQMARIHRLTLTLSLLAGPLVLAGVLVDGNSSFSGPMLVPVVIAVGLSLTSAYLNWIDGMRLTSWYFEPMLGDNVGGDRPNHA